MYSQNDEEKYILDYFSRTSPGQLLDIGANDGITLSNSRALIENFGWAGIMIEPSPKAYKKLFDLYADNMYVITHNFAIGNETGKAILFESGEHLGNGDIALLSSLDEEETKRWTKETFTPVEVDVFRFQDTPFAKAEFRFITIDAEGRDYDILVQIDLTYTLCVCVEYNNDPGQAAKFKRLLQSQGFHEIYRSYENLIFGK